METPPPAAPIKTKITIERPGEPTQTHEVDDFFLTMLQEDENKVGKVGMFGQGPASGGLLDHAFWNIKVGGILQSQLRQAREAANKPPTIIVPR